jgi:hypothetical protein
VWGYSNVLDYIQDEGFYDISGEDDPLSDPDSDERNVYPGCGYDFKVSMYLELTSQAYVRTLTQGVNLTDNKKLTAAYKKTLSMNGLKISDTPLPLVSWFRELEEQIAIFDSAGRLGDYIRGLYESAGGIVEAGHLSAYYRKQEDTVYTETIPLRSLFIFIRLVTVGLVRDFILQRFLRSNEDIVLKSPVCREIEIESRIH